MMLMVEVTTDPLVLAEIWNMDPERQPELPKNARAMAEFKANVILDYGTKAWADYKASVRS